MHKFAGIYTPGHPRPPLQPVPPAAVDAIRDALAELHLLETSDAAR